MPWFRGGGWHPIRRNATRLPDQITFEAPEKFPELVTHLRSMGHTVIKTGPLPQGDSHAIWVTAPNDYLGVADHRFAGKASGY